MESSRSHKLKTRPYDRWDVWANETYFDDTERCTPYEHDYTVEKKREARRKEGRGLGLRHLPRVSPGDGDEVQDGPWSRARPEDMKLRGHYFC